MKQKITGTFLLLFILFSCSKNKNVCNLYGKLDNVKGKNLLFLVDYDSNKIIDTIQTIEGDFNIHLKIDRPTLFILRNQRNKYEFRDRKEIWLEPSELTLNGDWEFLKNAKLQGSVAHDEFSYFNDMVTVANTQINHLNTQINSGEGETESIILKRDSLRAERNAKIVEILSTKNSSYVTLFYLSQECFLMNMNLTKPEISKVFEKLDESLKVTLQGKQIEEYLSLPEVPGIGDEVLEIVLPNLNGDTTRLSDYRGKYVLIDFWSSWCGTCRASNKQLVKLYTKFNPDGFEILGISGDNDKNDWMNAVSQDSMKWENVSDLKGWHNRAFLLYDIKYIPRQILIDPQGIIIGNQYCGTMLETELERIFNKN